METGDFEYHNACCFKFNFPNIGPTQDMYYDLMALKQCCQYIEEHKIEHPIVYILACRVGPFAAHYQKKIHKLSGKVYVNPHGHEWMRQKWSVPIRKYWKVSESLLVKHTDLLICDSKNIEKYIQEDYQKYHPKTTFISYGSDTKPSTLVDDDSRLMSWYQENGLTTKDYYLVVGRFVRENNYETMIRKFMRSCTIRPILSLNSWVQSTIRSC